MTIKDVEQLLRSAKDAPEFGGDYSDARMDAVWSKVASQIGIDADVKPRPLTWRDYADYFGWRVSHVWVQPASVALSAFALIFGGWVTTVNASFDSLPGDVLYPVKLVTERVQITLATSGQQRARLHAEFAGRRLDELNVITTTDVDGKDARLKAAVDGFKQEIASVNDELANIQTSDPGRAAELAIIVDQKTDEYQFAIAQSEESGISQDSKDQVAQALDAVEQSNTQAINTIVQSHESNQQPQTEESLQQNFQSQLADINTRVALSLGRLAVVESVLAARAQSNPDFTARIRDARDAATSHDEAIQDIMDTFAAGGYRTAFDKLAAVSAEIAASEATIAELEIELTTGL